MSGVDVQKHQEALQAEVAEEFNHALRLVYEELGVTDSGIHNFSYIELSGKGRKAFLDLVRHDPTLQQQFPGLEELFKVVEKSVLVEKDEKSLPWHRARTGFMKAVAKALRVKTQILDFSLIPGVDADALAAQTQHPLLPARVQEVVRKVSVVREDPEALAQARERYVKAHRRLDVDSDFENVEVQNYLDEGMQTDVRSYLEDQYMPLNLGSDANDAFASRIAEALALSSQADILIALTAIVHDIANRRG